MSGAARGPHEALFDRLDRQVLATFERHREELAAAQAHLPDFLVLTSRRRREAIESDPRYRTLGMVCALEGRAREMLAPPGDMDTALELLLLAAAACEDIHVPGPGDGPRNDLLARLYTEIAEVHSRCGRYATADEALGQAAERLVGHPAADTRACYCWVLARLRVALRREDEALALYARAAQLYSEVRDDRNLARVLCELERYRTAGSPGRSPAGSPASRAAEVPA